MLYHTLLHHSVAHPFIYDKVVYLFFVNSVNVLAITVPCTTFMFLSVHIFLALDYTIFVYVQKYIIILLIISLLFK